MNTHRVPASGQPQTKVRFYVHFLRLAEELYTLSEPNKQTPQLADQRRRLLYGAVLFLAFALESFINEVAIDHCQDDFEAVDRLSTPDKWRLVPKICGKVPLQKNKQPLQTISEIFRYRNLFVHYKPRFQKDDSKEYQNLRKIDHACVKRFYQNTVQSMQLLRDGFRLNNLEWLDDKKLA